MSESSLELRSKQTLALTPRLQQAVRLLQLSSLEFAQELNTALATNPFLEYDNAAEEAENGTDETETTVLETIPSSSTQADNNDSEMMSYSSLYPTSSEAQHSDNASSLDWIHAPLTLRTQLHQALRLCPLNDRDRLAAQVIIESLDDDGYLREALTNLVPLVDVEPALSESDLYAALKLVQKLDLPGVGARTLSECLALQLEAMPADTPGREVALELVSSHLDKLARREQAQLQRQLHCSASQLNTACALVRKLSPKPGRSYESDENNYIVPDVIVRQIKENGKKHWAVVTNPAVMPGARLYQKYATLFAQSGGTSRSPLAQQLQEARWLIHNAQQRFTTIQRVAECIVKHQKAFFDYGEVALRPLVLRDIAQELELHESTVSRATSNKYMATPRGIFEFKHFFPRELSTDTGGTCSAAAVRSLLKDFIDAENGQAPFSDVALTKMLAKQGVIIARRTVAKYRRLMKVQPAQLRRQEH